MTKENDNIATSKLKQSNKSPPNYKQKNTGFKRIIKALGYSLKGYKWALRKESAIRQETFMLIIGVILTVIIGKNYIQYILMISSILLVIIVELLNSAIEAVVDRISSEHHELSGSAKDMGSCAVSVSLLITLITWVFIILHNYHIIEL